jgi:hypothetical protein
MTLMKLQLYQVIVVEFVKKRFYWPSMTIETKKFIKECDVCQRVNPATLKVVPEMEPITVPKMVRNYILIYKICFLITLIKYIIIW